MFNRLNGEQVTDITRKSIYFIFHCFGAPKLKGQLAYNTVNLYSAIYCSYGQAHGAIKKKNLHATMLCRECKLI